MFLSATRLRLRRARFLPGFLWHTFRSERQARKIDGFIAGKVLIDRSLAFWTLTLWRDEIAMRSFRNTGAHRTAMAQLFHWCDDAVAVSAPADGLGSWLEAHSRLQNLGHFTPVQFPSPDQTRHQIAPPSWRLERQFGPIR